MVPKEYEDLVTFLGSNFRVELEQIINKLFGVEKFQKIGSESTHLIDKYLESFIKKLLYNSKLLFI